MRSAKTFLIFFPFFLNACGIDDKTESILSPDAKKSDAAATPAETVKEGDLENAQVSFTKDLLPLLSANTGDKIYKCTTCHPHYATADGLDSVYEVERIITSLSNGTMPRGGTRVPVEDIKLFKIWQLQGFNP